jgi:hypothetical protein
MHMKSPILAAIVSVFPSLTLHGQEFQGIELGTAADGGPAWVIRPQPKMFGVDARIGNRELRLVPGLDTTLWIGIGGAYEPTFYLRKPDGTQVTSQDSEPSDALSFYTTGMSWGLGISQGLLRDIERTRNILESTLYYRGILTSNNPGGASLLLRQSGRPPDAYGILQNSLFLELALNVAQENERSGSKSGLFVETSLEWSPEFFFNTVVGKSDFSRLTLRVDYFLPLFVVPKDAEYTWASLTAGNNLIVDYLYGSYIPILARQSIGGFQQRPGLGGWVRGLEKGRFDAELKAVDNLELRMLFPSLVHPDLIPGIFAFLDSGYYRYTDSGSQGVVCTTGAGIVAAVFNKLHLSAYMSWALNVTKLDGSAFSPFGFSLQYHF